ncbi:hypothetical protein OYT1_ch1339 [Ferriphaselus amnicola]|uniref:Uncharacterized protein n=1 Tax=Ferriphaselus amnicola TaxID=1188319 RepID=A0A2Z6GBQ8_9PROT|nr:MULTISPECIES: hypothetical protein [Ferriphaselus]BBE50896.1 hypothetical protein OYT1_ch1339 [Ferriphaselus amnicola]
MAKRILLSQSFNAVDGGGNSYPKYRAGEHYEPSEETERLVAAGIAEAIEVADETAPAADQVVTDTAGPPADATAA